MKKCTWRPGYPSSCKCERCKFDLEVALFGLAIIEANDGELPEGWEWLDI